MTELSRVVVIDDTDPRITYTGQWTAASGTTNRHNENGNFGDVYQNTLRTTTSNGARLSFTFTGNAAQIYGTNDPARISDGVYDPDVVCTLDGNTVPRRNQFQYRENNWLFCSFDNLSSGQHTVGLEVRTRGRAFWFDRLHYRPTTVVEGETVLAARDDADIQYNGSWQSLAQVAYFTTEIGGGFSFPFFGTRLTLMSMLPTELSHTFGQASYTIDGGEATAFAAAAPRDGAASEYNYITFETPNLPQGRHVLAVQYNGPRSAAPLVLDSLIIQGGTNRRAPEPALPPQSPPPEVTGSGPDNGNGNNGDNTVDSTPVGIGPGPSNGNGNGNGNGNSVSPGGNSGPVANNTGAANNAAPVKTEVNENGSTKLIYVLPSGQPEGIEAGKASALGQAPPTGAIIGGALGGLTFLLLSIALAVFLFKRRAARRSDPIDFNPSSMTNNHNFYHNALGSEINNHNGLGRPGMTQVSGHSPSNSVAYSGYTSNYGASGQGHALNPFSPNPQSSVRHRHSPSDVTATSNNTDITNNAVSRNADYHGSDVRSDTPSVYLQRVVASRAPDHFTDAPPAYSGARP